MTVLFWLPSLYMARAYNMMSGCSFRCVCLCVWLRACVFFFSPEASSIAWPLGSGKVVQRRRTIARTSESLIVVLLKIKIALEHYIGHSTMLIYRTSPMQIFLHANVELYVLKFQNFRVGIFRGWGSQIQGLFFLPIHWFLVLATRCMTDEIKL